MTCEAPFTLLRNELEGVPDNARTLAINIKLQKKFKIGLNDEVGCRDAQWLSNDIKIDFDYCQFSGDNQFVT